MIAEFSFALFLCAAAMVAPSGLALGLDTRPLSEPPPHSAQAELAATNEKEIAELLPGKEWDDAALEEIASRIASMPDQAAAELLWRLACADPDARTGQVFAKAAMAASPRIRTVAVAILIAQGSPEATLLAANALARERDPEVIRTAVDGFANLPRRQAVEGLMSVVLVPNVSPEFMSVAAETLRRLTGTRLSGDPEAWKNWWSTRDSSGH